MCPGTGTLSKETGLGKALLSVPAKAGPPSAKAVPLPRAGVAPGARESQP